MSDIVTRLRATLDEIERIAQDAARHSAATLATADRHDDMHQPPYDGTQWSNDYDHVFVVDTRPGRGRSEKIADCGASAFGLTPHIATHDPARVLADIAAKRKILDLHQPLDLEAEMLVVCAECDTADYPCPTVRLLAEAYGITE